MKKNKKWSQTENIDLDVSDTIKNITSNDKLDFDLWTQEKIKKPILISGSAGVGKSTLIKKAIVEYEQKKEKKINNYEIIYINCIDFIDTINEQKEDYFKLFISKIIRKIKNTKNGKKSKNGKNFIDRSIFISIFYSLIEFIIGTIISAVIMNNYLLKSFSGWILIIFLFTIFFIFLVLIYKEINEIGIWWNYKIKLEKLTKKSKKTFIIFDEINRLIVPENSDLTFVEKKFIKEVSSIRSDKITFVFVTSESIIDNPKKNELDFHQKYFSKVYRVKEDIENKNKIIKYYLKDIDNEAFKFLQLAFKEFDYRRIKYFLQEIKNNEKIIIKHKNHFDEVSLYMALFIKCFDYHFKNFKLIKNKADIPWRGLNNKELIYLSDIIYDERQIESTSWNDIEKEWKEYITYKSDKSKIRSFGIKNIFEEYLYIEELMLGFIKNESKELKQKIKKYYTNAKFRSEWVGRKIEEHNSLIDQIDFEGGLNYTIEKPFAHHAIFNINIFDNIVSYNLVDEIISNELDSYWKTLWFLQKIVVDDNESVFEEIIQAFNKGKLSLEDLSFCITLKVNKMIRKTLIKINKTNILNEFVKITYSSKTTPQEKCHKVTELILSEIKNDISFVNFIKNAYKINNGGKNFQLNFNDLVWELIYCKNSKKEKKEILDFLKSFGIELDGLRKILIKKVQENKIYLLSKKPINSEDQNVKKSYLKNISQIESLIKEK
ncbi:hypothetical protein CG002_02355 [Mesoplasma florum]|uniref:hypothetical protein n=1 Tax=Mesoplasma florum TaxID=2151 RepID=UPI000D08E318|nr:hypothetical protein [Mesoplasma florum]AVN65191.1 hypothetical protein CG002_02355 [Mesoplasma florum]